MEQLFKARIGRPKSHDPHNETESVAVTASMYEDLMSVKAQGLKVGDMTREYWTEILRRARDGEYPGITLRDPKRSA